MEKKVYHTINDFKEVKINEDYSKKLPNFQLIKPLTVEQQIERFTAAGKQMEKYAGLGVYDFDSAQPIDDVLDDPTRDPDYDLIDAATTQRDLALKMQAENAARVEIKSEEPNENTVSSEPASESAEKQSSEPVSS